LIERPKIITIKYYNDHNEEIIQELSETKSRIVQHELEHLEGISFIQKENDILKIENLSQLMMADDIYDNWYKEQLNRKYLL